MPGTFTVCDSGTANIGKAFANVTRINEVGVDSCTFAQNTNIAPLAHFRTLVPLPNSPTYASNTTLTANTNILLTIDGTAVTLTTQRVLVLGQADSKQNGLYNVTAVGSGAAPWVLTRTTGYTSGTALSGTIFVVSHFSSSNSITHGSVCKLTGAITVATDPFVCVDMPGSTPMFASNAVTQMTLNIGEHV
jgi:hypothetical protein